jgi:predicted nucleic acid-binding protein
MREGVLDASPVIVLARAGLIELLPDLLARLLIPQAVAEEIEAGPADDPGRRFLAERPDWLTTIEPQPALSPLASWRLGRGESEVLEYARQNTGTVAVLDDKAARRAARALEVPVTGTLGLLITAVERRLLPSIDEALRSAQESGLYVSPATLEALIKR